MKEPIEDGVGVGGIADGAVPGSYIELAGHDGGFTPIAILDDLEQIMAGLGIKRLQAPVIEDQKLDLTQALELARDATIAAR